MFCAQALRLPDDQWAILTLLVLMNGQYVGAFAFKGVMRMTGTIVGAVVGLWLVSNYASTPAVFLLLFFVVIALAGYKYGQVGARQRPYVYFLVGLTVVTVAGDAVTTLGKAWQFGLYRTEEIFVGIVCSLLVSNLVWPRYAREEFFEAGRAALKTVSQLFSIHALTYISVGDASVEDVLKTVPRLRAPRTSSGPSEVELHHALDQQFACLRNLLQAGARESAVFSARLANYNAFMVSLNNLFHAGLALHRHRGEVRFLEHLQNEIESVFAAISREFEVVTGPASPGAKLPPSFLKREILKPRFECLRLEFKQTLDAFAECFREGDCSHEFPTIRGSLKAMDRSIEKARDRNLLGDLPSAASLRLLDIVNRYHAIADALNECCRSISSLQIERYWGDYSL
jgi:hypothetical protein